MRLLDFRVDGIPKRILDRSGRPRPAGLASTLAYFLAIAGFAYSVRYWHSSLVLDKNTIDFQSTRPEDTSPAVDLTLTNTGNAPVALGPMRISGEQANAFRVLGDTCAKDRVPINGSCVVHLEFRPLVVGAYKALLTLSSSDAHGPQSVALYGQGAVTAVQLPETTSPPDATDPTKGETYQGTNHALPNGTRRGTLSPNPLTFDHVTLPLPKDLPVRTVRLTNTGTGTGTLRISTTTIGGADSGLFYVEGNSCSGSTILPKATCSIQVAFGPSRAGTFRAQLKIESNATPGIPPIDLLGNVDLPIAPTLVLDPQSLDFGPQHQGDGAVPARTVTLRSTGGSPYVVQAVRLLNGDPKAYSIESNHCVGASMTTVGACTFAVHFRPHGNGVLSGTVGVIGAGGETATTLALVGQSYSSTLAFSPTELSFALPASAKLEIAAGAHGVATPPQSIAVTNASPVPIRITAVRTVAGSSNVFAEGLALNGLGADSPAFSASGGCSSAQLNPGDTCTIEVSLKMPVSSAQHAYLVVTSAPSNEKVAARLSVQ